MRIRATRRAQAGPVSVELECDIECEADEVSTVDKIIYDVDKIIYDVLFEETNLVELPATPFEAEIE